MRLSVVIVNWNTSCLLAALLDSISAHAPPSEYEVIVVDNASSDFEEADFRARFPQIGLIRNPDNVGCAAGNNRGITASHGQYVLLLNPDTQVTDGALESLVRFMNAHPEAAAAGGRLVRPDGEVERSVRSFPYPGPIAWEAVGLSRILPRSPKFARYRMGGFSYAETAEVDQPMGSCLILSRRAIEDVGLFDEQFPIFFNEVDWLYRAKAKGYAVYFTPEATFIHHGASSTRQAGRRKMIRESHESLIRFYRKHFKHTLPAPVYALTIACIHVGKFLRGWI